MLGKKIDEHDVQVYLVNTGWTGGEYGVGSRMKLSYTRSMVQAALEGELNKVETSIDPIFGLHVPHHVPGVPDDVLFPRRAWADSEAYDRKANELATEFNTNFNKFNNVPSNYYRIRRTPCIKNTSYRRKGLSNKSQ